MANIIWELNIADIDGSEFCFVLDSHKDIYKNLVRDYISLGKPVDEQWTPLFILKREEKYRYDFFHIREKEDIFNIEEEEVDLAEDAICITQKVYNELFPFLKNDVEFLPLISDDGIYYIMNVINMVDCLDKEASECNITSTGLIIDYEELIFDTDKLQNQYIFRIPELPFSIFLTDKLKEIIEDYDELSFTADELVFDGISYFLEKTE